VGVASDLAWLSDGTNRCLCRRDLSFPRFAPADRRFAGRSADGAASMLMIATRAAECAWPWCGAC